jgi:hypothetical protein
MDNLSFDNLITMDVFYLVHDNYNYREILHYEVSKNKDDFIIRNLVNDRLYNYSLPQLKKLYDENHGFYDILNEKEYLAWILKHGN